MQEKKNKSKGNTLANLGRLLAYIFKNYKVVFIIVIAAVIIEVAITMMMTLFMQSLVDDYILPLTQAATKDYTPLAQALKRLIAALVVGVVCAYIYTRTMVTISQGTMKRLRKEIFFNMESLPIRFFDTHEHGDIMSVYTNDVDTLRQFMSQALPRVINALTTLVAAFVSMLILCVPLAFLSLVMVVVMLIVSLKLSTLSQRHFISQQKDLGAVNGYIEEMMEGQKVVKVFCHEEKNIEEFRKLNEELRKSANEAFKVSNIVMPINVNLGNISYVLVAIVGGVMALSGHGAVTIGTVVAFLSLNKSFSQPISTISQQIGNIVMASAGAERAFRLRDQEPETDEGYVELVHAKKEPDGSLTEISAKEAHKMDEKLWAWKNPHKDGGALRLMQGEVTFENVNFGYTDEKVVLHDIKMYAHPGQKIAFVGSTGAGKTTITNLINRFYDIQEGSITYDGIDIVKIKKDDLRRSLGMVLQDTHLFTGTVMDNIRYGRLDATDEECIAAARLANADGFIRRLPEGYDTVLQGSGTNLSQGQRQLLSIARAAVADPPVLILDEATSSIDTHTEQLVQRGMDELMKGRTSFVIAHRLSTVKDADCIMVMEQGRIIERGTHEQLIEQQGRYYQLYTGHPAVSA